MHLVIPVTPIHLFASIADVIILDKFIYVLYFGYLFDTFCNFSLSKVGIKLLQIYPIFGVRSRRKLEPDYFVFFQPLSWVGQSTSIYMTL